MRRAVRRIWSAQIATDCVEVSRSASDMTLTMVVFVFSQGASRLLFSTWIILFHPN